MAVAAFWREFYLLLIGGAAAADLVTLTAALTPARGYVITKYRVTRSEPVSSGSRRF